MKRSHDTLRFLRKRFTIVARPVGHKALKFSPKAQASLDVERDRLMNKKAWGMGSVREWKSASDEAKREGGKSMWAKCLRYV